MRLALSHRVAFLGLLSLLSASCSKQPETAPNPAEPKTAELGKKPEPKGPAVKVRIGYQKIGSPFLLKERAEGLNQALATAGASAEWIEFPAGPPILEAMRGDAVDIGYVGETPPVFPKNSKISKLTELKGKKVAVNRGSNVHYLLVRALESVKLSLSDVEVVFLAPADARSAFDSGKLDAWVIWDPFQAAAEIAGARVLRDGEGLVSNQFFYVARRAFAQEHAELVRTVLKEFATLSDWAGAHPEEASQLLAKSSGVSYEALLTAEKRHAYGLKAITPEVLAQQQQIADAFFALKITPKAIKLTDAALPVQLYGDAR
jgi:sulfonate transport system substrate-binding protein